MNKIIKNKFKLFIPLLQFSFLIGQSINLDNDIQQKLINAGISTEDMQGLLVPGLNFPTAIDVKEIPASQNDDVIKQEIKTMMEFDTARNSIEKQGNQL